MANAFANTNPDSRTEDQSGVNCALSPGGKLFLISGLPCLAHLVYNEKKQKGGEYMKIKVHVRAGGPKAR